MLVNIEDLKKIDWANDSHVVLGKVTLDIVDVPKAYTQDFESQPWDTAYRNITANLFGSFPISMQLSRVIDKIGSREVLQKFRRVTITYDPQFPDIVVDDDPVPLKTVSKRKSKGSYGI